MFVDGELVGGMEHGKAHTLRLPARSDCEPCTKGASAALLILVHAMGRNSAGCSYDFKGLVGEKVVFEGARLPQPSPANRTDRSRSRWL